MSSLPSRFELEEQIKQLTGGASPKHGDALIFDNEAGWSFNDQIETIVRVVEEGPTEAEVEASGGLIEEAGPHNHNNLYYTEAEVDAALSEKSDLGHTHDDRYYTEAEVDALIAGGGVIDDRQLPYQDELGADDNPTISKFEAFYYFDENGHADNVWLTQDQEFPYMDEDGNVDDIALVTP